MDRGPSVGCDRVSVWSEVDLPTVIVMTVVLKTIDK